MNRRPLVVVLVSLAGLASLVLLFSSAGAVAVLPPSAALAADQDSSSPVTASASEIHVCTAGPPTCDHASVQDAVDAAGAGDVIKVAAGIYTGVNMRPRNDVTSTGIVTQLVYISKTVTIQGGYTITNWTDADPVGNPTTLNAQAKGRVIYAVAGAAATIAGLRITGGNAAGLGGGGRLRLWTQAAASTSIRPRSTSTPTGYSTTWQPVAAGYLPAPVKMLMS
jgi:hypothetical protein